MPMFALGMLIGLLIGIVLTALIFMTEDTWFKDTKRSEEDEEIERMIRKIGAEECSQMSQPYVPRTDKITKHRPF